MDSRRTLRWALVALCCQALSVAPPPRGAHAADPAPTITMMRVSPAAVVVGRPVRALGAAESAGGAAATLAWDFGDGSAAQPGTHPRHVFDAPGRYDVALTASAADAPDAVQTFGVTVNPKGLSKLPAATLSTTKTIPFQYVAIFGDFETDQPTVVEFLFGKLGVIVTPTVVTERMIRVAVPPLLKKTQFVGGSAKVLVIQGTGAASTFTYAGKVKVKKLRRARLPLGETTQSFIRLARGVVEDARDKIGGTAADTPEIADTIASTLASFDAMAANIDAAVAPKSEGLAAIDESAFRIDVSKQTVKQLDRYYAGVAAAGLVNTNDPDLSLAYKSWGDALQRDRPPDPDSLLALIAAEQRWRDQINRDANSLTDGLNTMMAPTTSAIASMSLVGTATGNPAILLVAGQLAVATDVLMAGIILGLVLDAAATTDPGQYQVYLQTAGNLTGEFATGKVLGAFVKLAGGKAVAGLFGDLRTLANDAGAEIFTWRLLTQPAVPADLSLSITDVSAPEGNLGSSGFEFTVNLSGPTTKTVSVTYATSNGSASAGSDYVRARKTSVSIAPGEVSRTISIDVNGDDTREESETFFVTLSKPVNAALAKAVGVGTILNDDAAVFAADSGSGDFLGGVSGCGDSTQLFLDGAVHFVVQDGGVGGVSSATVTGTAFSADFGTLGYSWAGPLTWSGDTLSGTLARVGNPARPSATVSVTKDQGGRFLLTATVPFTYLIFLNDGSCTGPLHTFNHQTVAVVMQQQ